MTQAQRRSWSEGGEDLLVVLCEGRIGDQKERHVALADCVIHLAERTVCLGESDRLRFFHGGRSLAKTHFHPNVGAFKGFAQVLCLRWAL